MNNGVMPLSSLGMGESCTVVRLEGGAGLVGRLVALGFTPGATVEVVRNNRHGPLIVAVLDTHIALGRGQAARVHVARRADAAPSPRTLP
jgi:ferrous iron transport protein A